MEISLLVQRKSPLTIVVGRPLRSIIKVSPMTKSGWVASMPPWERGYWDQPPLPDDPWGLFVNVSPLVLGMIAEVYFNFKFWIYSQNSKASPVARQSFTINNLGWQPTIFGDPIAPETLGLDEWKGKFHQWLDLKIFLGGGARVGTWVAYSYTKFESGKGEI